ncbi:hypothetical protein [Zooshikella harenae]|uniref:Histone deacetylase domain-containing protein n=1 Tax=Zooshikella harenae TaxID=2827238 RepID=A0ABS5ZIV4_9GAMM|nr:hypothetical protein [Zooshikella harenae]MBU2713175.1 hypothetical protein [Zooshikella harenae]
MVYPIELSDESCSPLKPKLLLEYIQKTGLEGHFEINQSFSPFQNDDFLIAHTPEYVNGFFDGVKPHANCSGVLGINWSEKFASSVRYTNSSLYAAIRHSIVYPENICFSPTSGFHHAIPDSGALFCAFSGQVIASVKIYREFGLSGAYIDLDGHIGNSIEDSRDFVLELNEAVPKGLNINLTSKHEEYIENLKILLSLLKQEIVSGKIHYVVFCHGADSHEDDDIGNQLTTDEWTLCSEIFYQWVKDIEEVTGKQLPVSLSLFGGYRADDFNSVLSLHTSDLVTCLNTLCGQDIDYKLEVKARECKASA